LVVEFLERKKVASEERQYVARRAARSFYGDSPVSTLAFERAVLDKIKLKSEPATTPEETLAATADMATGGEHSPMNIIG